MLLASLAHAVCEGDFDGNRQVTVDELVTAVNNAATGCQMFGYIDNGDGTVTDVRTGLMWEQKVAGSGCLHCVDDVHTWNHAMTDWITEVNEFSPYEDWRIPSYFELETLYHHFDLPCGDSVIRTDEIFCTTTSSEPYWSSTFGYDPPTDVILTLDFSEDSPFSGAHKHELRPVRAVRGARARVR
jgi:hypothetical protein